MSGAREVTADARSAAVRRDPVVAAAPVPAPLALPPRADLVVLVVALLAVSTSGPLIAATAAPTLAIAFWRNAMSSAVLLPWTAWRHRTEVRRLTAAEWRGALVAGGFLALHFATWVPSVGLTSVATATALVSTQPVWAALLARRAGVRLPRRAWVGMGIALAGVAAVTGVDVNTSARAVAGDGLAVVGGAAAAAYMVAGGNVRRTVSTTTYTTVCYVTTAAVLVVVCLAGRQPLTGYSADAWVKLLALTAGAQFLGHSLVNRVLRTTSPTVVALAILLEVPGASVLAAVWLHQHPPVAAIPGLLLLVAGIATVVTARDRRGGGVPMEVAPAE